MQFKKLAAIAGSALMAGLALTGPVLATTVTQLGKVSDMVSVTDSTVSFPMFVIGASAATADVAGAVDVAVNMASNAVVTSSVTSTIPGESVTGGSKIATSGVFLSPYANPQNVKGIMTASDIPSLLNGGTYSSSSGGSYQYKQYLYIGGETTQTSNYPSVVFERPTNENTPRIAFKLPSTSTSKVWSYKLTFSTPVSMSGVTDDATLKSVIQGTTLNMLGKDFIISDATWVIGTGITSVTLLGGKNVVSVETGTPQTVSLDSKDYTITLSGVAVQTVGSTTQYTALGDVNGQQFQLKSGQTMNLADGTLIAAISVFQGKTGAADFAKIAIGANQLKLTSTGSVTKGVAPVPELTSNIVSSLAAGWSSLTMYYIPTSTSWLATGSSLSDPLDTFNIKFNSIIPDFTDTANRQNILFTPSGYNMMLTYKNAADATGQMYSLYTTDGTTWRWASSVTTSPAYRDVVFDEGANITAVDQDYFVIQKAGFSHILQFISYTASTYTYTFTDEGGNTITATGSSNAVNDTADLIVDGNAYGIFLIDNTTKTINVDLNGNGAIARVLKGSSAPYYSALGTGPATNLGLEYSYLVPKLMTTGQGGLYFYGGNTGSGISFANQSVTLPAVGTNATAKIGLVPLRVLNVSGTYYLYNGENSLGTITASAITNFTATANSGYMNFVTICGSTTCNVGLGTSTTGVLSDPGFVLVQEAEQGGTTHNWLYLPIKWGGSSNPRTYVGDTLYSSDTNYLDNPILGTSTQYKGLTTYGTLADHLGLNLGGSATVSYPDVFTYANVYLMTPTGTISSGGTGGTITTQQVLPITADVIKLDTDSDINSVIQNNDVIIVGGPCINKIAAQVLDKTFPACGAESGIPENAALIKLVADKFATGKTALLIAGWEADNTDLAARIVQTGFPGATATQKAGTEVTVTGTVASPSYS